MFKKIATRALDKARPQFMVLTNRSVQILTRALGTNQGRTPIAGRCNIIFILHGAVDKRHDEFLRKYQKTKPIYRNPATPPPPGFRIKFGMVLQYFHPSW